jgi:hypothetical protein
MSEASVMLDRALLGSAFHEECRLASLNGARVVVRVLSPRELAEAGVFADLDPAAGAKATARELEQRAAVLTAACSHLGGPAFGHPAEVLSLPVADVLALWSVYLRAHVRTYGTGAALESAMDERETSPVHGIEQLRARYAAGLVAFYGLRSALDATPAQVVWFHRLRKDDLR